MLGETVIALGHPFRLGLTVTRGIVGGLNRRLTLGEQTFDDFMQVDAAINPGNSGGPLLDVTGRWIGVNTAIFNRTRLPAEGIGFAIPSDRVRSLIARAFRQRVVSGHWLGLDYEEGPTGEAVIQQVYPKGPARDSGLRAGDVVTSVNRSPTATLYDLRIALASRGADGVVELGVRRGERRFVSTITAAPIPTERLSVTMLGFAAEDREDFNGVVVTTVRQGGPAARVGLQPGDVVTDLGKWKIRNTEELLMFLQWVNPGDEVDLAVVRPQRGTLRGSLLAE
jgi:S1-C subfamily serine protease